MKIICATVFRAAFLLLLLRTTLALEPIPHQLVVLTFDDSVASHFAIVRPVLKKYGFNATFFITEGFDFAKDKTNYMTWEQIAELNKEGFEIGNHTRDHMGIDDKHLPNLKEQVETVNKHLAEHGIPRPTSFSWPGNAISIPGLKALHDLGFTFARRGGSPEYPYEKGQGFAYEPGKDHPLLIPSAGDARPDWSIADVKRAVMQAANGKIAVLQFHGAPDKAHPWVNTPPERFAEYMEYLHDEHYTVIAMRDLARYVDPEKVPDDPLAIIAARKASLEKH